MLASGRRIGGNSDVLLGQLGQIELEAEAAADVDAAFDPRADRPADAGDTRPSGNGSRARSSVIEAILEEHPTWTDVRVRCGMLLKLVGRCEQPIECFEQATRENPVLRRSVGADRADAAPAWATSPGRWRRWRWRSRSPEYADLHYRLGLIYCGEMEFDLAMERLEEARRT